MPWHSIDIGLNGEVSLCQCAGWMMRPVGNIWDQTLKEILSNQTSKDVRRSIRDGDYIYCNDELCQIIKSDALVEFGSLEPEIQSLIDHPEQFRMPRFISLAVDVTCNLSCPSCRKKVLRVHPEDQQQLKLAVDRLYDNLFSIPTDQEIWITMSTSGEIFASDLLMDLVGKIDVEKFPNVQLHLQTNGLLARHRWDRLGDKQHNIKRVTVSIDAGSAEIYETVRRGGRWTELQANLGFISDRKHSLGFDLHTRMVVQRTNHKEMTLFYDLSEGIGADCIEFCRITDWFSWTPDEFRQHDVFDPQHPEYMLARDHLESLKTREKFWSNC